MPNRSEVILPQNSPEARPLGEIVQSISDDVSRIVRAEVQVARAELGELVRKVAKTGGVLASAALAGLLAAACFVTTCIAAMSLVMPVWLASLLMGILLAFAAAGAYVIGRLRLSEIDPTPPQIARRLVDDVRLPE